MSWEIAVSIIDKTPKSRDDKGIDFVEYVNEILRNEKERNKICQSVYKNGLSGMKGRIRIIHNAPRIISTIRPHKIVIQS